MSVRTITEQVERKRVVKLSWKEIERERREYPHEKFTVYALMQSDGKMLGYVIESGKYWSCYNGDQRHAVTSNLNVSKTLEEAQERLMASFADEE